ncbi:MAG: hypothetical protein QOF61_935, partial [Acidobacteriota bacterium]|nr:hypothetical protein [Acidobacteriota bacterium]
MKTLSRILMLAALATAFALPAFAQDPAASPVALCDEPAKGELYTTYYNLKKTDQPKAYETAKQYLDKYGSCADNYTASVKKFATLYDSAQRRIDFFNAYDKGDVAKVNSLGAQILSADPNDAAVALLSAWGSYQKGFAVKTPTVSADEVAAAAQRAIALLESGKEPLNLEGKTNWLGFSSKDEALAYLNLAIAGAELKTNSDDAVKRLVQIAQGNTKAKEEASVYSFLKFAYDKERELMVARYKTVTKDFTVETPESQLLLAN